jgi:hypothetical protein
MTSPSASSTAPSLLAPSPPSHEGWPLRDGVQAALTPDWGRRGSPGRGILGILLVVPLAGGSDMGSPGDPWPP